MQQPNAVQVSIFTVVTIGLTIGLSIAYILPRRQEIMANWAQYKTDPFIMFGAPFFKPDDDPRSTAEFAEDNFMDVMGALSQKMFLVFLQPVFELFKLFTETILSVLTNIFSFREVLKNMFASLLRIFEPFMARFRVITNQLRMTFLHLKDAIGRVAAVATAAIFAGISAIRTMMNMFQLMQIVVAAIIITLVVLTIFFWFVLWPVVPIIIAAIAMIIAAGGGAALGDSAGAFCFAPDTRVECADGTTSPIHSIPVGTVLKGGSTVEATMVFQTPAHPFYSYKGVIVSGSHIVYEKGTPCFVQDSAAAVAAVAPPTYYCLSTSTRRIPVRSPAGESLEFADWEELDEDAAALIAWHTTVDARLNRCPISLSYPTQMLESEAVLSPSTLIQTPTGLTAISALHAGGEVFNSRRDPVRILGVVKMTSSNVAAFHSMGSGALSCSCWVQPPGYMLWKPMHSFARIFPLSSGPIADECWYSLFTEDGTFLLAGGWAVRDFTDVGPDHIADTHSETLRILKEQSKVE
jgi:hypothetical protein